MGKVIDATLRFIDEFTRPLGDAMSRLEQSGRTYQRVGKEVERVGQGITNAGKTLTATVTMPVVAAGTAAVTQFGEVDKTLRLVQETMGSSSEEAKILEDALKKGASGSVYGMQDAADASLNFARQGYGAVDAANMITPALDLAAGTATDLALVTEGLGSTLKLFGADTEEATEYADIFAKAQAQANTTVTDLFNSAANAGPIFKTVGWDIKDLAVATGVLGDAYIEGSEAGNAFKSGLANLVTNDRAIKQLKKLGVEIVKEDGTFKSFTETQELLHNAFADLTQEEQMQAATALFGKNQMAKWLNIIQRSPDDISGMVSALDGVTGTAGDMADALMQGTGGAIESFKSSIDVLGYSMGEIVGTYVTPIIRSITELVDKFTAMDPEMQEQIIKWLGMAAAIGPVLIIGGKGVTGIGKMITTFGKLGTAMSRAGGFISLITGPAGIAVGIVFGLIAAGVLLYKNWDTVKEKAKSFIDNIKSVFDQSGQTFGGFGEKIADVKEHFSGFIERGKELWEICGPYVQKFGELVYDVVLVKIGAVIGGAVGLFNSILNTVLDVVDGVILTFSGLVDFFVGIFTGDMDRALKGLGEIWSGRFQALIALAKAPINAVIGILNGAVSQINKLGITIPEWVPKFGGQSFKVDLPTLSYLYKGTNNWQGGPAMIHDRGAEIVDLPKGTRVYPHDKSLRMARAEGSRQINVAIPKIADTIIIREEADIDMIMDKMAKKFEEVSANIA